MRGLYHEEARNGNIHSSQTGNMLSGAPIASGGEIRSGTSFDQVIAQTYGRSTKVPSLVLACETSNPSVHKNYSMLYSSHISWSSPTTPTPLNIERPADGLPQNIAEHMRLMIDILVLGFQTDTTRVATLKLNNDHSALRFPHLTSVEQAGHGIDYMIHHLLSHSDGRDWLTVNQFFMEQLAYLARKLDSIQEGDRTLLDNTMLMHCSSMMAGALHNNDQLPVILLGGAGGRVKGGRVFDYTGTSERQLCRLFMSLLDKADIRLKTFGDATSHLEEV